MVLCMSVTMHVCIILVSTGGNVRCILLITVLNASQSDSMFLHKARWRLFPDTVQTLKTAITLQGDTKYGIKLKMEINQ